MKIYTTDEEIHTNNLNFEKLGLVPTMGNLHEGHLSLIKESKKNARKTIVSIFINPLQFSPNEDYNNYPRTIESDLSKLEQINCDYVFIPKYDYAKNLHLIKAPPISRKLCGKSRPGHFDGVLTIINKIFSIISPSLSLFGLKDYQQFLLIKHFANKNFPNIKIEGLPIIREDDGLAMSSRNNLLSKKDRKNAPFIFEKLNWIKNNRNRLSIEELIIRSTEQLKRREFKIDYLGIYNLSDLEKVSNFDNGAVIAIAAKLGKVRLIDNLIITHK